MRRPPAIARIGWGTFSAWALAAAFLMRLPGARATRTLNLVAGKPTNSDSGNGTATPHSGRVKPKQRLVEYPNNNPLSSVVREKLLGVIRELKRDKAIYFVKQNGQRVTVEEHGFDVIERFRADVYGQDTDKMIGMVDLMHDEPRITLINGTAADELRVVDRSTYAPYILIQNQSGGSRLVSDEKYEQFTPVFKGRPVPLADGLALYEENGWGNVIAKSGDPRKVELTVEGLPDDLGDEWAFSLGDEQIILPKANPVGALHGEGKYGKYRLYSIADGRFRFRGKRVVDFSGRPVDYNGSWLLEYVAGYFLLSKTDMDNHSSSLVEKPPLPKPTDEFIVVKTNKGNHIVDLSDPSRMSIAFEGSPKVFDQHWEVKLPGTNAYTRIVRKNVRTKFEHLTHLPTQLAGNGRLGERYRESFIFNLLDPTKESPPFELGPWPFPSNGGWVAKTANQGFLMISEDKPELYHRFKGYLPSDHGTNAFFENDDGAYFVNKADPTKKSVLFKRILKYDSARPFGRTFARTKDKSAPVERVVIETLEGKKKWLSLVDFSLQETGRWERMKWR